MMVSSVVGSGSGRSRRAAPSMALQVSSIARARRCEPRSPSAIGSRFIFSTTTRVSAAMSSNSSALSARPLGPTSSPPRTLFPVMPRP